MKKQKRNAGGKQMIREVPSEYGSRGIVLYKTPDGRTEIEVNLKNETVWLSLNQIALLFGRDKSVMSRHFSNIFKSKELERDSVVAFFATTATDGKTYQVEYYNLDAIISVGYRVNSIRGTQFRIWATRILHEHIVTGYTANERRLRELNQAIKLIANFAETRKLSGDEAAVLLKVVSDYSFALELLDDYDHQRVKTANLLKSSAIPVTYGETLRIIERLRSQCSAGELSGKVNYCKGGHQSHQ